METNQIIKSKLISKYKLSSLIFSEYQTNQINIKFFNYFCLSPRFMLIAL